MIFSKLGRTFSVSPRVLAFAAAVAITAIVVFGASGLLIGPSSASAGYLTLMFLIGAIRLSDWKMRFYAALWAIVVSALGYYVGTLGLLPTLVALVVVSIAQGLVRFGEIAVLTRSPVNLLAFTAFGQSATAPLPLLGGTLLGCAIVLIAAQLVPSRTPDPERAIDLEGRLRHGVITAAGSVSIVVLSEALGFAYASWALLSFCMILAVGAERRSTRAKERVIASVAGAVAATGISLLPSPLPVITAVICGVLCVAYLRSGKYALFVLFLTPAVLITTSTEIAMWRLGVYRIEAVCFAAAIALACGLVDERARFRKRKGAPAPKIEA